MEGEFVTWGLLGAIAAIDIAQFTLTIEHRGRLATLEERIHHELD